MRDGLLFLVQWVSIRLVSLFDWVIIGEFILDKARYHVLVIQNIHQNVNKLW
jgi:hypothetical protein